MCVCVWGGGWYLACILWYIYKVSNNSYYVYFGLLRKKIGSFNFSWILLYPSPTNKGSNSVVKHSFYLASRNTRSYIYNSIIRDLPVHKNWPQKCKWPHSPCHCCKKITFIYFFVFWWQQIDRFCRPNDLHISRVHNC